MSVALHVATVAVAVLTVGYTARADFDKYSIFTVGVFKRVKRHPVQNTGHECSGLHCDAVVEDGEQRRRFKEIVVAGCPVIRYGGGSLYYCEEHVSFEFRQGEVTKTTTQRLAEPILAAFVGFVDWKTTPDHERQESTPFDDVVTTASTGLDLACVGLLVLCAAAVMHSIHSLDDVRT